MAAGATPTNDAHGREEDPLVKDPPSSSSTKSRGKGPAYDEEHDEAASSKKPIPKANADNMMHIDMDDSLQSTPIPKKNQSPKIPSYLKDTQDHSPSRDVGPELNLRASKYGHDDYTQTGESSTNRSTGVGREGLTSPRAAELARGKAIQASDEEDDGEASSTEIIPKANAEAGPSVGAPAQHDDEVVAAIRGPAHTNASDNAASTAAPAIPVVAEQDVNAPAIATNGGGPALAQINGGRGIAVIAVHPAPAQPNAGGPAPNAVHPALAQPNAGGPAPNAAPPPIPVVAQQNVNAPAIAGGPPVPARINGGGGIAVIAARLALAQANAGGPAPNAAPPIPAFPPNPGVNYIDEVLMNSGIRPLRNPADGEEGKLWDPY